MEKVCEFASRLPVEKNEGWQSAQQRETLINLFKIPFVADNFWLTGGTCLSAMYLGHRQSEDLDLFTTCESIHPHEWQNITDVLKSQYDFKMPTVINPTFASLIINNTKVDFVSDMFAYKEKRPEIILDGVTCKVDSWDNLCVAKFSAFLSRISDKDISDIGAILQTATDDHELKNMCNFLICETRKRDSIADELRNISDIVSYASEKIKNLSYKETLSKFSRIIIDFEKDIAYDVEIQPKKPEVTVTSFKENAEQEARREGKAQLEKLGITDGKIYFADNNRIYQGAVVSETAHALIQHSYEKAMTVHWKKNVPSEMLKEIQDQLHKGKEVIMKLCYGKYYIIKHGEEGYANDHDIGR